MARCVLRRLSSAGSYCPPGTINPIACGAGNYVLELCVLLERAVQCPGGASTPTGVPLGELLVLAVAELADDQGTTGLVQVPQRCQPLSRALREC